MRPSGQSVAVLRSLSGKSMFVVALLLPIVADEGRFFVRFLMVSSTNLERPYYSAVEMTYYGTIHTKHIGRDGAWI